MGATYLFLVTNLLVSFFYVCVRCCYSSLPTTLVRRSSRSSRAQEGQLSRASRGSSGSSPDTPNQAPAGLTLHPLTLLSVTTIHLRHRCKEDKIITRSTSFIFFFYKNFSRNVCIENPSVLKRNVLFTNII